MSYSRFALGFSRSRKISRLSDGAFRLWSSAIDYCREQLTDGFLDEKDLQVIPRGGTAGPWKVATVAELVGSGLWERTDGGWHIREFLDWQDSAHQVRTQRDKARERIRNVRANKKGTLADVRLTYSSILDPRSDSSTDPDLETRASGVQLVAPVGDQPKPRKLPGNLADALLLPITERAEFVEQNKHLAEWVQPEAWPEVKAIAAALHAANRGVGAPKVGKFGNDSGVKRVVELYAAGFTEPELLEVCQRVVKDPWWTADGGKPRSLGALTVEVARRATSAPGALEHAGRVKAAEASQLPYHQPARRQRESGPVMPSTEVKALLAQVLR